MKIIRSSRDGWALKGRDQWEGLLRGEKGVSAWDGSSFPASSLVIPCDQLAVLGPSHAFSLQRLMGL